MADWIEREYSKAEIDRTGQLLPPWWHGQAPPPPDLGHQYLVIQNWRTSHAFPLNTFQMSLRKRARRVESDALVAQRLKRFSSVMLKLHREPTMKLSQMQDLGGCRAIFSSVGAVYQISDLYRGSQERLFQTEGTPRCYDYIRRPKEDGYRGIHLVVRYKATIPTRSAWNGHRIEIQLRSRLQHAFATAVETVTTFTQTPLKFGGGPHQWRRFFSLTGAAFALREGTSPVPGTPESSTDLIEELRESTKVLKVRQRLRGWTTALEQLPRRNIEGAKWLLLVLDVQSSRIKVTGYSDRKEASEALARIEQSNVKSLDAVLVWVRSIKQLRAAYPNYYADTTEFIDALNRVLR